MVIAQIKSEEPNLLTDKSHQPTATINLVPAACYSFTGLPDLHRHFKLAIILVR